MQVNYTGVLKFFQPFACENTQFMVFWHVFRRLLHAGQLHWQHTSPESERSWSVVSGLVPGVQYEFRVVARNGDARDAAETSSPVRKILLGNKKGDKCVE